MNNQKLRIAVIPSDPIDAYIAKGITSRLKEYYNPLNFFEEVYLLSPLEADKRKQFGMTIMPTKEAEFKRRLKSLGINIVRAYGGYWPCDMACNNKVKGIPVVVSVHDTNQNILYGSIKNADIVFCVSSAVRDLVLTKFRQPGRIWILPNRVDLNVMRPRPQNEWEDLNEKHPFKHKILHVGRKSQQKNLDTLIKALKILGPEYCLLAIGRGDSESYVEIAREQNVLERCYFIDSIDNEELPRYYSWADCTCVPSRWEGFGVVFIEALACESVVVTSDIGPMNEFIEHKKNGLLINDYEKPQVLAEMIKLACNDHELRNTIKENARKSVAMFAKSEIDKLEASYYKKILEETVREKTVISPWRRIKQKIMKN